MDINPVLYVNKMQEHAIEAFGSPFTMTDMEQVALARISTLKAKFLAERIGALDYADTVKVLQVFIKGDNEQLGRPSPSGEGEILKSGSRQEAVHEVSKDTPKDKATSPKVDSRGSHPGRSSKVSKRK